MRRFIRIYRTSCEQFPRALAMPEFALNIFPIKRIPTIRNVRTQRPFKRRARVNFPPCSANTALTCSSDAFYRCTKQKTPAFFHFFVQPYIARAMPLEKCCFIKHHTYKNLQSQYQVNNCKPESMQKAHTSAFRKCCLVGTHITRTNLG